MEGEEAEEKKYEDGPPNLRFTVRNPSEIPNNYKEWRDVDLPIDILLLAVEDWEFLSCFYYLDEPFKSYEKGTGYVYFGSIGSRDEKKLKVALIKCPKASATPGGCSITANNVFKVLRPKAVFSVGICSSLNSENVKLGDVVISSKLTTPRFNTPVSPDTGNLIRDAGSGWEPPLQNPDEQKVTVHKNGVILSLPLSSTLGWNDENIKKEYPEAIAVETEGEGLYAAAYVDKVEWMIVKGVASYGDPTRSPSSNWASFASTMAASVVASILRNPGIFQEWPHYNEGDNRETSKLTETRGRKENEDEGQMHLQAAIESMKDRVKIDTEQLMDFKQPFRPNPGEGRKPRDLKLDEIYVDVVFHEGRLEYNFPEDRSEQLNVYFKPNSNSPEPARPQDIIGCNQKHTLVVGRPGIGKTMLCTKLLRIWAVDDAEMKKQFDVVCLLKFRHLNMKTNLNLNELLARSETVEHLDEKVLKYIQDNPTKVLLIFDGIDEFPARSDIANDDSIYKNTVEEKMPLHSLYNKLASGKLLRGATVISTIRPAVVECVIHLNFDRTVEVVGFSTEQVKGYVAKFMDGHPNADAKEIIWQHIRSNLNIFSLCYVPVNCFIICHCFVQIINTCAYPARKLPTKITDIYSMTVKIFFFKHNRDDNYSRSKTALNLYIYKPFNELQPENDEVFKRLGKIAFDGIKNGKLIFESSEVKGLEDCGLLHRLPDVRPSNLREPPKSQYCFMHLTIQEFFAAKHVTDTMNEEEIQRLASHIHFSAWQVVMQFVAGLLKPGQDQAMPNVDIFTECLPTTVLIGKKENEEDELSRWPNDNDKRLALHVFRCIYEADVEQRVLQSKIAEIGFDTLDFSSCSLVAVDFAAVVHFLKTAKGLLHVDLRDNEIDLLGCLEIADLLKNSEITTLNLSSNSLGAQDAENLCDALKGENCNLIKLDLSINCMQHQGAELLRNALKDKNCKLTKLGLRSNFIGNQGTEHLCDALKDVNCKLTELDVSNNDITYQGTKHLCGALKDGNSNLAILNLGDNNIGEQGAAKLCDALKDGNCKLTELNLSYTSIGDQGALHLCNALKHVKSELTELDLSGNQIGDQGAALLGDALKYGKSKLTKMNLNNNSIGEQGVADLCNALKHVNCKLAKLSLKKTNIGDPEAKHLCAALKDVNCKLVTLNLSGNKIGDQGATYLWDALKDVNFKLSELNLEDNNIGDQGVVALCDALKNLKVEPKLHLKLSRNYIDRAGPKLSEVLLGVECKVRKLDLRCDQKKKNKDQEETLPCCSKTCNQKIYFK